MHHTRPQVESKDADPNPPIKIHGPLASTFFLRAIHTQAKKTTCIYRENTCKNTGINMYSYMYIYIGLDATSDFSRCSA